MGNQFNAVMSAERALRRATTDEARHNAVKHLVSLPGYNPEKTVHRILTDHANFTLKSDGEADRSLRDTFLILAEYLPLDALLIFVCAPYEGFQRDLRYFRENAKTQLLLRERFQKTTWREALGHLQYLVSFESDVHNSLYVIGLVRGYVPWPEHFGSIAKAMMCHGNENHEQALMRGWRSLIILASSEKGRTLTDILKS